MGPLKNKKILFITNAELGEAQVYLATCHAVVQEDPNVEIHFATYGGIEKAVQSASNYSQECTPRSKPFVFHEIQGTTWYAAMKQWYPDRQHLLPASFLERRTLWNWFKFTHDMLILFQPWTGPQLAEVFQSVVGIIKDVNPDLCVVDTLQVPGATACHHLGTKWLILSPNCIKEFSGKANGNKVFWKFPFAGSTLPYPIPWYLIPLNVFYGITMIYILIKGDARSKEANESFTAKTGAKLYQPFHTRSSASHDSSKVIKKLVANLPELEYPYTVPDFVVPCGPIVRPAPPISESEPELTQWLARGPTVYINLGTHALVTEDDAVQMALALRVLLDTAQSQTNPGIQRLQVLWKLRKDGNYDTHEPKCKLYGVLGHEMAQDQVRIVSWIDPEPITLLQTGHVVLTVNHGGANSFGEGVSAGVPQVIMAQWLDTYDFANRAELTGIGRWGNQKNCPKWTARELAPILVDVLLSEKAPEYRAKAKEMATLCNANGGGRVAAARFILAE